jgi:hypothetical protein
MDKKTQNLVEIIRENTLEAAGLDDMLEFFTAAKALGLSDAQAEQADAYLTERMMRARGAI